MCVMTGVETVCGTAQPLISAKHKYLKGSSLNVGNRGSLSERRVDLPICIRPFLRNGLCEQGTAEQRLPVWPFGALPVKR